MFKALFCLLMFLTVFFIGWLCLKLSKRCLGISGKNHVDIPLGIESLFHSGIPSAHSQLSGQNITQVPQSSSKPLSVTLPGAFWEFLELTWVTWSKRFILNSGILPIWLASKSTESLFRTCLTFSFILAMTNQYYTGISPLSEHSVINSMRNKTTAYC